MFLRHAYLRTILQNRQRPFYQLRKACQASKLRQGSSHGLHRRRAGRGLPPASSDAILSGLMSGDGLMARLPPSGRFAMCENLLNQEETDGNTQWPRGLGRNA